jgi:hypothetical protein
VLNNFYQQWNLYSLYLLILSRIFYTKHHMRIRMHFTWYSWVFSTLASSFLIKFQVWYSSQDFSYLSLAFQSGSQSCSTKIFLISSMMLPICDHSSSCASDLSLHCSQTLHSHLEFHHFQIFLILTLLLVYLLFLELHLVSHHHLHVLLLFAPALITPTNCQLF